MCILFIALQTQPRFPLILCANRDEIHARPTQAAHFWQPEQHILAGKDLEAGGTWLAINRQGKIAGVTNYRAPAQVKAQRKSRGELPLKALSLPTRQLPQWLSSNRALYNPFNLLYGDQQQLHCYDSYHNKLNPLTPGYHAVSNGALDEIWPKMATGNRALEQHIRDSNSPNPDALLALLKNTQQAADPALPNTGIPIEWERQLSSIYIKHPEYGTRSSTVIIIDDQQTAYFTQVQYDQHGQQLSRQTFNFKIER